MLMSITAVAGRTDSDVVTIRSPNDGIVIITTMKNAQSRYIVVGTDTRPPITRPQVVMQVDRSERGVYYSVQPILGNFQQARLRLIPFDNIRQSSIMINQIRQFQIIAEAHNTATRDEIKELYGQIMTALGV